MATARMEISRTVMALAKKRGPDHLRPGPIQRVVFGRCLGDKRPECDALCRFQNANDAPPADAQNVTGTRKSCEVPSFPSFPHVPKNGPRLTRIDFSVVHASAGRSPLFLGAL